MAKQLNVNLAFHADTSQAQANLKALQKSLSEIANINPTKGLNLKSDIQDAVNSAKSLQTHLNNAFNVKTGNLDLKMLNQSLVKSGESLQGLTSGLLNCGIQGEKAFMNVQRAISTAGVQINQTQGLLGQFLTTLKNTARWQLSSSLLHGVIGSLNSAIGYAKDLDESLNNIRIVTGYGVEEMSKFAKEANAAAKALRTTTTEYTNASLIYYQQGLSTEEVKERTDITIKMANVARESAETISDQLTAVWNNFAKNGTQSLEHYADAMTKLGADTASSTDEIAGGLEKFASVADMIGLSFDNAAAALATITATTRQSEDVVGTALKTIFARIQGLNLGETLDDGTTLNKYSEALAKVGISIYDAGGGLKDMDNILTEMGAKWETISKDQQVALAQTIAGVRQYNQLVALMDNFDFYEQNLNTAKNADGELNRQQQIYEESWEAARDRVKASMEGLYEDLIPTDAIIEMTDGFSKIIDVIDYMVEGLGGLEGIFLLISNIAVQKLGPSLSSSIDEGLSKVSNLKLQFGELTVKTTATQRAVEATGTSLQKITGDGMKTATQQINYFAQSLSEGSSEMLNMQQSSIAQAVAQARITDQFKIYLSDISKVNNIQALIEQSANKLTVAQKERLAAQQQELIAIADQKATEQEKLEIIRAQKNAILDLGDSSLFESSDYNEYYRNDQRPDGMSSDVGSTYDTMAIRSEELAQKWTLILEKSQAVQVSVERVGQGIRYSAEETNGIANASKGALNVFNNVATMNSKINRIMHDGNVSLEDRKAAIKKIVLEETKNKNISYSIANEYLKATKELKEQGNESSKLSSIMKSTEGEASRFAQSFGNGVTVIREVKGQIEQIAESEGKLAGLNNQFNNSLSQTSQLLMKSLQASLSVGGSLTSLAQNFSSVAMAVNAWSNASKQAEEGTLNLVTASMVLATTLQAVMGVLTLGNQAMTVRNTKKMLETALTKQQTSAEIANILVTKLGVDTDRAAAIAEEFLTVAREKGTAAAIAQTMANLGLQASLGLILAIVVAVAAAVFLLVKAFQWSKEQSPEYKLQQAEERAKALEESLNEAKNAAEELKSAFDEYDGIKKTLNECVKGTEEWTQAIKANNDAVLDLMADYPELSSMVNGKGESAITRNGDILEVADWAREELENQATQRVSVAQAAAISGRQAVREAQINVDRNNLSNDFYQNHSDLTAQQYEYDSEGYLVNSYDGSFNARDLIMENAAELSRMNKEELTAELTKLFNDNQLSGDIESWVDAIIDMGPEFRALADSIDANTRAIENENDVIAQSALADNQVIQSSKYKDQILTASGDLYEQLYEQEMQKLEDRGYGTKGLNKAHKTGGKAKDYWDEYLKAANLDAADYKLVDTTGTDAKRKFVYKQNGEEKEIDLVTMKTAIASAKAMEALGQSAEALMKKFMELGATTGDITKDASNRGLISFLSSQNLEGATKGEFNALKGFVDANGDGVTQEESDQYLIDNFGINGVLDDETAKAYGFDTAQQMKDAFYESMQLDWDSIELPDNLINVDSLSMSSAKAFEGIYKGLEEGGEEALTGILNGFDLSALDPAEQTAVWDKLAAIDWSNWNAVEQAANIVTEAGGYLDNTNTSWAEYIALLRDATNAVPDLQALKEELNAIDDISEDISLGDIITKEDYETLIKYNQGLMQYFAILSDGSAQFIGDQLDFQQQIKDTKIAALKDAGVMYQDRSEELMNQYNSQLDLMGGKASNFEDFAQSTWYTNDEGNWYKGKETKDQLEFLKLQGYDPDQIAEWEADMADGTSYKSTIDGISEAVIAQGGAFQATKAEAEAYMASYQATMNEIALLAEDSTERLQMLQEGSINTQAYDAAVNAAINAEAWEDLDVAEVQEYANYLEDAFSMSEEESEEVARAVAKMNRGVETLSDNWDDWGDVLKTGNKEGKEASKMSQEYAKAMQGTRKALSDVLDISEEFISTDFVSSADNLALIEKAAKGDSDAIDELSRKLAEDIATSAFQAREAFHDLGADAAAEELEGFKTKLQEVSDLMQSQLGEGALNLGDTLSGTDELFAKLQEVVTASGMTAEQANAYYRSMGFTPNFKMVDAVQAESVPLTTTYHTSTPVEIGPNGERSWVETEYSETRQVPGGELHTALPAMSMETADGHKAQAPSTEIESVTYTGGGSLNNFSSTNSGGKKPGGGGTKKSSKKKKEDEIERYHTINKEMDSINRKMERAASAKDAAFGRDKLPYIQQEIDAINELIEKHKEYKAEIAENLKYDAEQLAGFGFTDADADGILENWEAVMEEQLRIYNEAAAAYDNGTLSEEAFQEACDKYEEFKKLVEQYEETHEKWEEALAEEEEHERQRISKELEQLTTEIEFEIEINQRDLDRLDRIVDRLGRDTNNMIEIIDQLGQQVGYYSNQSQFYRDGIARIKQNAVEEGRSLTDEEQRKIWEYEDALEGINDSLYDMVETVEDSLLEEFERWNSEIDENIARFNVYSSTIEHYSNIIKLSGRESKDAMLLMQLQSQRTSIAMEELNANYDKWQANLQAQADVKAKLDLAIASGDQEDIEYWQKQYNEITKVVEESHETVTASWEEALTAAQEEFEFAIDQTIQKLKDSISQFGLDGLADRYEKAKTVNEQYLSDLEKEYELNKLTRQIEGSINDTDNLNAKRDLIKLLDEVNKKTAEGVKLSQYDLEYMQAEYELELAKLALEEARNAKTSVRLQRGDDGNYSYVYTADQEEIANAEQNYEDKLFEIKQLSQDHLDEMSDLIIQNEQELMEALAEVDKTKFETEEAYLEELDRITQHYYERDTYLRGEMDKAIVNLGTTYHDTTLGYLEDCGSQEEAHNLLVANTNTAINTMGTAWTNWKTNTEIAMSQVGTSSANLQSTIQTNAQQISSATSTLASDINTQTSNMRNYIQDLIEKIWEWRDAYLDAIRTMQSQNTAVSDPGPTVPETEEPKEEESNDGAKEAAAQALAAEAQEIIRKVHNGTIPQTAGGWRPSARKMGYSEDAIAIALKALNDSKAGGGYDYCYEEALRLVGSYDTGGFTGAFGPEGKLAFLHEKELVLNKEDTANILNAVDIVRSISQQLDRQAQIATLGFAGKASINAALNDGQSMQVEQEVTIHAEFPNATDQSEIREAILGLVNYTAQYVAHR